MCVTLNQIGSRMHPSRQDPSIQQSNTQHHSTAHVDSEQSDIDKSNDRYPLAGKTALVTGVSRRRGIGFAVATKFLELGASVFFHHYRPHDLDQPWGGDEIDDVRAGLEAARGGDASIGSLSADLSDPAEIPHLMEVAEALTGTLDILVCNHAKSGDDGSILDMTADRLDAMWSANARSTLLLTRQFAEIHAPQAQDYEPRRPGERIPSTGPHEAPAARVFWMTSGQIHGPMPGEVAYATSKAALAGITPTVASELLKLGIVLNTINPGPVNTGYLDADMTDKSPEEFRQLQEWTATTAFGRFGRPTDSASLIGWLATDEGAWVVGQVLTSDGGFSLG
ncbi:SDR family oxidoreductase [Demequina aurantiaca]|uniref:SDR family oxidoreductase n=1 Tax=Demequina aurantiaca TaxID=676200 RepID=UPI000B13AC0C|nr:SDR family oxidoreductase [Demequina aurantiaca]